MPHPRHYTPDEDLDLTRLWGRPIQDIARMMEKSAESIRRRANKLGLKAVIAREKPKKIYTKEMRPPEIRIAYGTPKTMLELAGNECRWPLEDSTLFCGAECEGVYCKAHKRIAFRQ